MPIRFACACGKAFAVKDEHAGKRVKCKACGAVVTVPQAAPAVGSESPAGVSEPAAAGASTPPKGPSNKAILAFMQALENDGEDLSKDKTLTRVAQEMGVDMERVRRAAIKHLARKGKEKPRLPLALIGGIAAGVILLAVVAALVLPGLFAESPKLRQGSEDGTETAASESPDKNTAAAESEKPKPATAPEPAKTTAAKPQPDGRTIPRFELHMPGRLPPVFGVVGQKSPRPRPLLVPFRATAGEPQTFSWRVKTSEPWLVVEPKSGESKGASGLLRLTISTDLTNVSLQPGRRNVTVTIVGRGADVTNSTFTVSVMTRGMPSRGGGMQEKSVVRLPGKVEEVCVGSYGRYLVFKIKDSLAVFDVHSRRVARVIKLQHRGPVLMAAGATYLLYGSKRDGQLHRWNFRALEEDRKGFLPEDPVAMAMGADQEGPGLVLRRQNHNLACGLLYTRELDCRDMDRISPLRQASVAPGYSLLRNCGDRMTVRAAARGSAWAVFDQHAASGLESLVRVGQFTLTSFDEDSKVSYAVPTSSGGFVCTDRGVLRADLTPVADFSSSFWYVPGHRSATFLGFKSTGMKEDEMTDPRVAVYVPMRKEPLLTLSPLDGFGTVARTRKGLTFDKRVFFLPHWRVFAMLTASNDQLLIRSLDVTHALSEVKKPFLFTYAEPPCFFPPDSRFCLQLRATDSAVGHRRVRPPKYEYRLKRKPEGMKISSSGTITWEVPKKGTKWPVKVEAEVMHPDGRRLSCAFSLDWPTPESRRKPEIVSKSRRHSGSGARAPARNPPADMPEAEAVHRLKSPHYSLVPSDGGKSMLLMHGTTLTVLDAEGIKEKKTLTTSEVYTRLFDRKEYCVALGTGDLVLLDKRSMKPQRRIRLPGQGTSDLALHPGGPVSYVAVIDDGGGRRNKLAAKRVVEVNEASGKVTQFDGLLGQWVAIDPKGQYLYTALREMFQVGWEIDWYIGGLRPGYGQIDVLVSYDISGSEIKYCHANFHPGANGRSLRISPKGTFVSYVAGGGYRSGATALNGYTIPGFRLNDVSKAVLSYKTGAYPTDVAFHPILDLVVATNGTDVLVFDEKSAERQTDRFPMPVLKDPRRNIKRVFFSAGGRHVLVDRETEDKKRELRVYPLQLTEGDNVKLKAGPKRIAAIKPKPKVRTTPRPVAPGKKGAAVEGTLTEPIPASALDGLRPSSCSKLTAQGIAKKYKPAVVIVRCARSSGTGFFVGRKGYVLTCAHVLTSDKPTIVYKVEEKKKVLTRQAVGQALRVDPRLDLALVKIDPGKDHLTTVRIELRKTVEMGEQVCIIGHPGLGNEILDYTMTSGIVSNTKRVIDGLPYVQTNAAINPGVSGGPMFDGRGLVVGLVVLKARIDNVGFAVPAATLVEFLKGCTRKAKP